MTGLDWILVVPAIVYTLVVYRMGRLRGMEEIVRIHNAGKKRLGRGEDRDD